MTFLFYLADSVLLLGLAGILIKQGQRSSIKKALLPALALKLLAGMGIGMLYMYYYDGGDTLTYFNEAVKLTDLFANDPGKYFSFLLFNDGLSAEQMQYAGQPRALFMVKLVSIVNFLTYNNYWFSSAFFSFFCFAGLWALAETLNRIYPHKRTAILLSLLFFPSVIFWSSGILKESIALGAMGFLIASFLGYIFHQKRYALHYSFADAVMIFMLWNTKYYFAAALLLMMMAVIFTLVLRNRVAVVAGSVPYQLMTFALFCILFIVPASLSHPNFYFHRIFGVVVENYYAFMLKSEPQNVIHYHNLEANWGSFILNAPKALFSGFFRPFMGTSALRFIAGLESLLLFVLSVGALFGIPKKISSTNRLLVISGLIYCMAMSIFLALSVPNFGTLVRYKTGFLPIFLLLITINNPLIERVNALIK